MGAESPQKKNKNGDIFDDDEEEGPTTRPTERKFLGRRSSNASIEVENNQEIIRPSIIAEENKTPNENRPFSNTSSQLDKSADIPNETVLVQVHHKRAASAVPISFKY